MKPKQTRISYWHRTNDKK